MLSSLFLVLHVIAGFVALILFWVPMFTRKGGKAHRKVGWIYVVAMTIVAISAFYLGMWRIFFDPDTHPDSISFYWFLLFISILSFATSWYGESEYSVSKGEKRLIAILSM